MSSTILDPSTTIQSLQETLSLDARLVKALIQRLGLRRPTLVQAQVWPLVLQQGRFPRGGVRVGIPERLQLLGLNGGSSACRHKR